MRYAKREIIQLYDNTNACTIHGTHVHLATCNGTVCLHTRVSIYTHA